MIAAKTPVSHVVIMILAWGVPVAAEEVSLHGFVQGNYAARITGQELPGPEGGDVFQGKERLQIKLATGTQGSAFFLKTDVFRDAVARIRDLDVREAYIDSSSGPVDLRLGRQIITWGVGDLIFLNDVFPKDYAAFFCAIRPSAASRIGSAVGGD